VWLKAAVCVTVAGLAIAGCSKKENTSTPGGGNNQPAEEQVGYPETNDQPKVQGKPGGTFRLGITEPTAIDPYNAQESEGSLVTHAIFTGLSQTDFGGHVTPALAEKWSTNDKCDEWTFNLKKGTKFHNGEEVTSASFKLGWERAAAKASASDVAYHMDQIDGYDAISGGTATTMSGLDASDPAVLKVKLAQPSCEFYIRTVHTVFSPVPKAAGAADNKAYNDLPIGNGPFMMDGPWQHDKGIKLKRFDGYTAGPKANLDAVEITITGAESGSQEEYDGFNNGSFDWARMPVPVLATARAANDPKGQWISKKTSGINYLLPMVTQKPLDTPKARAAISLSIDRKAIAEGVFQKAQVPATAFVPAGFKDAYQAGVCKYCKYDPEQAKKLAQEAGLTPGTELKFQFNAGAGHEEWTAAVKQQIEKTLGLKVVYGGVPFKDMLKNEQASGASGIFRAAWGADYPTAGNFLQPLLSTKAIGTTDPSQPVVGDNRGRYSNKQFDDLLDKAAATKDEGERNKIYKQAEQIAIGDDLALIPMFARQQFRLANTAKFANVNMDFFENPMLAEITLK
jgi:oligopeptide transport system substrate-binding protein